MSPLLFVVPKIERDKGIGDYRPISLLKGTYKVVAKVLAIRLKAVLPKLVSDFQCGGMEDKLIQEGILVANELIDSRIRGSTAGVALKLDFRKAFDTVS